MYLVKQFKFICEKCILVMLMHAKSTEIFVGLYLGIVIETIVFAFRQSGTEIVAIVTKF